MPNRRLNKACGDPMTAEVTEDRRRETRTDPEPDARHAVVRTRSSGLLHGAIADVSFSGLALAIADASGLTVGERVELLYRHDRIPAVVKYVLPSGDHYRVGFEIASAD